MRRFGMVLTVVTLMVLLTAPGAMGGGENPGPPPAGVKITGPAVSAVVVMQFSAGFAARASIRAQKGTSFSGVVFNTARTYGLGCDLSQTADRFLYVQPGPNNNPVGVNNLLSDWVPGPDLTDLLNGLGLGGAGTPVITDLDNVVCTPSGTGGDFSFSAVIQFQVPH